MGTIEYRDFDGDLGALAAMARDSWFEEYGVGTWPDLYKEDLARHFFSVVDDPRYLVGAYDGADLVAFVANLPRTYRLGGQTWRGAMSCMLVGHRAYRRQGLALGLIKECLRRNEDLGRDFSLMTLEARHRSALLFDKHLKPHHRIERVRRVYPIARAVDFPALAIAENLKGYERAAMRLFGAHRPLRAPEVPGEVRPYRPADLEQVAGLIGALSDRRCLVRVFAEDELAHQLDTEGVTHTLVYERDGAVRGFANFTRYDLVDRHGRYGWAWLDFLHYELLEAPEKRALLAGLWDAAGAWDCIGVLDWDKGYYPKMPLFRAGFVPYPRFLELDAWVFDPALSLRGLGVVEQQI